MSEVTAKWKPGKRWSDTAIRTVMSLLLALASWWYAPCDSVLASEGKRLPASASAQSSAPGHGPQLAVDGDETTLWVASLKPDASNNHVWFQLDLGAVKQVARLHWLAAAGIPYPAAAPNKYQVLVSIDGITWTVAFDATAEGTNEPTGDGDVLLNTDARYVRLVTTKVNDGTGWALGLREIWVTGGRDTSAEPLLWHMRAAMSDGRITLTWLPPGDPRRKLLRLYRSASPTDAQGTPISGLGASVHEYTDTVPNWTPYYYWVQAVDSHGAVLGTSARVAAFAHPADDASERVETFAFWYEPYKPVTDPDNSIRHIGNAAFVVTVKADAIADLAKAGTGALSYVTLYQTHTWTGLFSKNEAFAAVVERIAPIAFYRQNVSFPGSPPGYLPTVFCRPGNIEYNPQAIQYTTCPNSVPFRDLVLSYARKQLADEAAGFFVDNGYDDDIAASSVCQSTRHSHYYGDNLTSADAFLGMLLEITCLVKKQNPHGVIMVNGGVPRRTEFYGLKLGDVSGGQLWEGYLRSSYSTLKEHVDYWESVYRRSVDLERSWRATPPRRMFVLSYPWDREEAFFCYATAKLCDLPWSAGLGVNDPQHTQFGGHFGTYPELVNLRLGTPIDAHQYGGEKLGEVYVRRYERGFVAVNPTHRKQTVALPLDSRRNCRDVFSGKELSGALITVSLPAESGRVYLYR